VGVVPSFPAAVRAKTGRDPDRPLPERWRGRPRLRPGSPVWRYLTETRRLPDSVLQAAADQDVVREGYRGSAWFAHRAGDVVTHIEARGHSFRGSLTDGRKTLFRFDREGQGCHRLVITEAPIDALSIAAIEGEAFGTVYVATGGGMGPGTIAAIEAMLTTIAITPNAVLLSATDANAAGERYAVCHAELAVVAGVRCERLRPMGHRLERRPQAWEGNMKLDRAWVLLPSGRRPELLALDPAAWTDRDLAIGLSRTYRWAGYSAWDLPLSVAQHSLTVLELCDAAPDPSLSGLVVTSVPKVPIWKAFDFNLLCRDASYNQLI